MSEEQKPRPVECEYDWRSPDCGVFESRRIRMIEKSYAESLEWELAGQKSYSDALVRQLKELQAQLAEANKYKTGWENQIKFIEEKKKRIKELEGALNKAGHDQNCGTSRIGAECDCHMKALNKGEGVK